MTDDAIPLRLVEWNVAMALHTKAHLVQALTPDIAVLPESAHPDRIGEALAAVGATSLQWIGASPNKGLLVVGFGDWTLRIDDAYDPGYQWVMPLHIEARHAPNRRALSSTSPTTSTTPSSPPSRRSTRSRWAPIPTGSPTATTAR